METQISHRYDEANAEWHSQILDVNPLCMQACMCPCIVYGKTQYRLEQRDQDKEATDLSNYKPFNRSCGLMALLCGSQAILATLQRTRIRKLYDINGSVAKDIAAGFCCLANILAQHEREVVDRETQRQQDTERGNGASTAGYELQCGMQYAAPT